MRDYMLLMDDDLSGAPTTESWASYFAKLRESGAFQGGSSIGPGEVLRKAAGALGLTHHLTGYIRIRAENLNAARALVEGNPMYECGGSVEIRELPAD